MIRPAFYTGRRFRAALRAFLFGRAVQGIAHFVLTLWVVRLLASGDYGVYMTLWGMAEMLVPLSSLGLLEAARRFLPELAARGSAVGVRLFVKWTMIARLSILLVWAFGLALAWGAITDWLGFSAAQASHTWQALILAVLVVAFRYSCEMLESLLEQRWSQAVRALHPVGRLVGLAGLFLTNQVTLAWILWVEVIVSLVCLLLIEWALIRKLRALPNTDKYRVPVRKVVNFSWHLAGTNLLQSIGSGGAQRLLVARLLGLEAAGLFSFLQQLLLIVSRYMPAQLLANVIRPMLISRLATGEHGVVSQGMALMWKSNLAIVSASVAVLVVAGDTIVALLSSWRFNDAGMPALLLFIGLGATSQGQLVNMAMQLHDKTHELRKHSLLFLLLPMAAWVGSSYGLLGLIIGIVMVKWFRYVIGMCWMRHQGVTPQFDKPAVIRILAVSFLAAALGYWVSLALGSWTALAVTLFLLVVGVILIRPLCYSDHILLTSVFKDKAYFLKPLVWSAR
ncbi:MAG: hypothetical protein V7718_01845 [Porticoccus sp.]